MTNFFRGPSIAARIALTCAIGIGAVALQLSVQHWVGARIPFLFFLPAMFLAATLVGRVAALAVLLAGFINGLLIFAPDGQLRVDGLTDRISLAAYVSVGMLVVFLGGRMRLVNHRATEAERRLGLALKDTGVGLFDIDLVQRTIMASPTLLALLERSDLETVDADGRVDLDVWNAGVPPEELEIARGLLRKNAAAGHSGYECEHFVDLREGGRRWMNSRVHIERGEDGRVTRLRGATVDVTERRQTDALLEQTRGELRQQVDDLQHLHELSSRLLELRDLPSQLQAVLQALVDFHHCDHGVISLYDPRTGMLRAEASIGFGEAAIRTLQEVEVGAGACGLAYAEKRRVTIEDVETDPIFAAYRGLARSEGVRSVHSTPLFSSTGEAMGIIAVHSRVPNLPGEREIRLADICARKASVFVERARARAVADESDQRFRAVLESSAVPFSVLVPVRDAGGGIVDFRWSFANTAAARVLHRTPSELIGQKVTALVPAAWENSELFAHYVAVAEEGETHEFELFSRASGAGGWFHVVASPLPDAVAIWYADVSGRKQQEQALQEADRRKDEFLATLAHELRNPLAPIRQAALISKAPTASDAQKRWSHDVIDRQVQHMAVLLDDLLDVSRITRGMLQLRMAPTELASVVDAAIETARPAIDARHHRLQVDLPPHEVRFHADQLRIAQVLGNLLTNAAKYTEPGGTIRLQADCSDTEVCIAVTDNGIGIHADVIPEVFKMFTQIHPSQDRAGGGLGIGLALARGLIELHGGSISASSGGPGLGSRFEVRLPHRATAVAGAVADVVPVRPQSARRILIADDNRDAADSLAEYLRINGHEVRVVYDGEAAVAEFSRFHPDAALFDIGMPRLNGNEAARRVRATAEGKDAILVAVTGWGQERDKSRTREAGFDHHMTKPIDLHRLTALLSQPADAPSRAATG